MSSAIRPLGDDQPNHSCSIPRDSLDAFPDAFIELDANGLITSWNARAEAMFGWRREECLGREFCESMVQESHQRPFQKAARAFFAPEGESPRRPRIEIRARTRDGPEVPLELSLFLTRRADSDALGIFARDITHRLELEQGAEQRLRTLI